MQRAKGSIVSLLQEVKKAGRELRVATHCGVFHADETMCLAIMKYLCDKIGVTMAVRRTRDLEKIKKADIVFDVGMTYDPSSFRFDHHQKGGAGCRTKKEGDGYVDGTRYSSIGAFWQAAGMEFCNMALNVSCGSAFNEEQVRDIWRTVDKQLIEGIDALDTGEVGLSKGSIVIQTLAHSVSMLNPLEITWGLDPAMQQEKAQEQAADYLLQVILGCIMRKADILRFRPVVQRAIKAAKGSSDPWLLMLDNTSQAWRAVSNGNEGIFVVVQPQPDKDRTWAAHAVPKEQEGESFLFPEEWSGLGGEELEKASGVRGMLFCHENRHIAFAVTKEALLKGVRAAIAFESRQEKAVPA